jgi:hypothetical protein
MNKISARALQWVLQFKGNCTTVAPAAGINVFPQRCVRHLATQEKHYNYASNSCSTGKA